MIVCSGMVKTMSNISVGSVCSGIEAASVAWGDLGFDFQWFSEISAFPSNLLKIKYPHIKNLGDMCDIPENIKNGVVNAPDLICGGTPCQAFSLAGWKKGLEDTRGNLTLKFVDIIDANDVIRKNEGLPPSLVFWENVEGVLRDKTNAFGCFLSSLAGAEKEIKLSRWPQAGIIHGPKRNIAWRILDAKYFGLPQQRRRLYLLASGKDFFPEKVLFEVGEPLNSLKEGDDSLSFEKNGHAIEVFRNYTDCLYSAYGTKWNGNAAAYNGSLFVLQNKRLRRFTPLECERLMGFPDNYTNISGCSPTTRYQGVGNSWAVPVIRWIGTRIKNRTNSFNENGEFQKILQNKLVKISEVCDLFDLTGFNLTLNNKASLNCTEKPLKIKNGNLFDVIEVEADEKFYITPVGCNGILRRREERKLTMNKRLKEVLQEISGTWSSEKIEIISRKQSRGRFSDQPSDFQVNKFTSYSLFI